MTGYLKDWTEKEYKKLEQGVIWKEATADREKWQPREFLERAVAQLRRGPHKPRLLLVFDQFEELVIIHGSEPQRVQRFPAV